MLFTEPIFLFFFLPLVLLIHHSLGQKLRNLVLVVASLAFYAWGEWRFLPILLLSVAFNYVMAIWIERLRDTPTGKILLTVAIGSDLGLLAIFKYSNFAVHNINAGLGLVHAHPLLIPTIALPLGISFFTFHKISYKVDVYRGTVSAIRNPIDLGLYILLFPQLIAGPIIRYHEIADQITHRRVTRQHVASGVRRFIVGLGKKVIIANTLALPADRVFSMPTEGLTTPLAWFGVTCYALQLYFDFSGYTDMAVGLGSMFGFVFPENFNYPYIALSITDFWRRWHMSLSRWFRDYLYIPLGGNRLSTRRTYANLLTVFFFCGLWHGANWNFVAWGLFHGAFLVIERLGISRRMDDWPPMIRRIYTMFVVLIGWVLFRAPNLHVARAFIAAMIGFAKGAGVEYHIGLYLDNAVLLALVAAVVGSAPVWPVIICHCRRCQARILFRLSTFFETASELGIVLIHTLILLVSITLVMAGTYNPFIYFRF